MRGIAALIVTFLFYSTSSAQASVDLSPVSCTWDKLPAAERTRLTDEFKADVKEGTFTLFFSSASAAAATEAAQACQLTLTPAQIEALALSLGRHAAVEKAKTAISALGESPTLLHTALEKMHEGKREVIGDALACPGPHKMVREWDQSIKGAMKRGQPIKDGRAVPWLSLGLYASFAEEGAVRRMTGANTEPC